MWLAMGRVTRSPLCRVCYQYEYRHGLRRILSITPSIIKAAKGRSAEAKKEKADTEKRDKEAKENSEKRKKIASLGRKKKGEKKTWRCEICEISIDYPKINIDNHNNGKKHKKQAAMKAKTEVSDGKDEIVTIARTREKSYRR